MSSVSDHFKMTSSRFFEFKLPVYKMLFDQPSSNYLVFMAQLWKEKVCLDTIGIVHEKVSGTIKVINLSYEKKVEVKITYNLWRSFVFVPAKFQKNESMHIDIFTFQFYIPPKTKIIEFCIKYLCNGEEYWDNNQTVNYRIEASYVKDSCIFAKEY